MSLHGVIWRVVRCECRQAHWVNSHPYATCLLTQSTNIHPITRRSMSFFREKVQQLTQQTCALFKGCSCRSNKLEIVASSSTRYKALRFLFRGTLQNNLCANNHRNGDILKYYGCRVFKRHKRNFNVH